MEYKYITAPTNCTGCALCANVCSRDAIHMEWSSEGFLIPKVNTESCINCGLCIRQCIALEERPEYTDDTASVATWGGWNKHEATHLQSSSGGIFTALAEHVLFAGGCVFGVVWQDKYTAIFSKAETLKELAPMRGSKYTPAIPGKVYQEVLAELKTGRQVLFSGTPCQVHALKKYLRKPFDNLLTIDIVCHGAPSHLLLEKYVQETEARTGKIIDHVSFRDKPEGWLRFHVTCHYTDGSTSSAPLDEDSYMRLFLSDKALNLVCYNCPYAHIPRQGDITLGDYWGVQNLHPDWPIDKGISAILSNSPKGTACLEQISNTLELHKEFSENILERQRVVYIRPQKQIPKERTSVLRNLPAWPLEKVYWKLANAIILGPFRLSRTSIAFKCINPIFRTARHIKRKLITLIWQSTYTPPRQIGIAQVAVFA